MRWRDRRSPSDGGSRLLSAARSAARSYREREDVLVAFRAAGVEKDLDDDRPLQSRRTFTIGRYWGIVTVREGRVVRVRDYPGLRPGLEALGLDEGVI